jgi:hypothetical protein
MALLIHLLLGTPRSRPRAGGGWARPLPSREGVGDGWSSNAAEAVRRLSRPTASLDPPTSSPRPAWGTQLGDRGGTPRRTGCNLSQASQRRGRRASPPGAAAAAKTPSKESSTGVSAAGVTARLARRTSRCELIDWAARHRAWRVTGVTRWPAGGMSATRSERKTVRTSSGPVHVLVKGKGPRTPGTGRAAQTAAVCRVADQR